MPSARPSTLPVAVCLAPGARRLCVALFLICALPATTLAGEPQPASASPSAGRAGLIEYRGRVIVVSPAPVRREPARATRLRRPVVVTPAPAAPASVADPAPTLANTSPSQERLSAHAKAAEAHAYQHFRYKYRVGSVNYAVTSLHVVIDATEEVPNWGRHRSTGEAGIEFHDGATFRRATRRFEVLTEEKDGRPSAVDIDVRF